MPVRFLPVAVVALMCSTALADDSANKGLPETIEFNRDIRPILSDKCFYCHGPDKNKREADLRLDTQEGLTGADGKGAAIIPGKPDESPMLQRVHSTEDEKRMPPVASGKSLTDHEKALLRKWIEQGGKYEGHWSFLPIRTELNAASESTSQVAAKIDQLVRKSLDENHLQSASEADKVTLLRRLHFDLTGLPPSPEEVRQFVADTSADAYEKKIDELLKSPHSGERLAMWWLDLVRYADTVGYHGDQDMSVAPYRQYVIESFNANKPFDQFTIEQLAGDLLPNATREQKIASGYNRLGMMSAEGGVQDKEYLAKYIAERVRNASGTWLGITMGCCECHNHKFDPLTTKDFYRFEAFFADIREQGLYAGAHETGNWGPFMKVPTDEQTQKMAEFEAAIADRKKILETQTESLTAAQLEWEKSIVPWMPLTPDSMSALSGTNLTTRADGAILAKDTNPDTETYTLTFSKLPPGITAFRIDVLTDDSLPQKGPGRAGNGNFVLSELIVETKAGDAKTAIPLQNASASYEQTGAAGANPYKKWAVEAAIDGDAKGKTWGWAIMEKAGQPHFAVFETQADLTVAEGQSLVLTLAQNLDNPKHNIGCFRISCSTAPRPLKAGELPSPAIAAILAVLHDQRNDAQKNELAVYYRSIAPLLNPVREELASLEKQRNDFDKTIPTTLVTETVAPRMVRVLPRGNWMDESGEVVTPAFPSALAPEPAADQHLTRLDLAKWIVAQENPLAARVVVNRLWKIYFGAGLSRKLDDLGAQGEWPSHPLLLDYLAQDLKSNGWDLKRTIRAILLSQTYRQSSLASKELREADPYNKWLARQGRFRLDAELVRDNALEISGLLVKSIGGRSVKPYQPAGYWAYLNFPTREWQNGNDEQLYRRGLYTHWQRQYLHPSLLAFDAPSREECTADRPRSNTPLQSLALLNDPTYVEAARAFAELILRDGGDSFQSQLDYAFQRAMSRPASDEERAVLESLWKTQRDEYQANEASADELLKVGAKPMADGMSRVELAAWTSVARTILNLHEVITRN
ncbi:MAG: PSD1 domain-containing protein [Planctomycetaceae bacterium]|nr:PSD1 domain-containing protein [Planctomycetaceae bacterium]